MSDGRRISVRGSVDGGGGSVIIQPNGLPVVGLTISGTFSQTLVIEELIDGGDPTLAQVFTPANVAASATQTAPGRFLVAASGRSAIRVRQSAYVSGTAIVVMVATQGAVGGAGGGGGGAVTIADGADVTQGTTTDAAAAADTSNATIVAFWKRLLSRLTALLPQTASGLKVDNSAVTQPVSGTVTSNQGTQNGAGTASWPVQGAAAAGAALAGNPVRMGISDGTNTQDWKQQGTTQSQLTPAGIPAVGLYLSDGGGSRLWVVSYTDAMAINNAAAVCGMGFNGTNLDRIRNNVDVTLLASAARTTTQTGSSITAYNCQAIAVTLDVTAIVSTCSLTVTIGYVDPASGKVVNLLTSAVIAAVSTTMWLVDPRVVAAANLVAQKPLGRTFQITVTVGNANSQTYSLGYTMIPC